MGSIIPTQARPHEQRQLRRGRGSSRSALIAQSASRRTKMKCGPESVGLGKLDE